MRRLIACLVAVGGAFGATPPEAHAFSRDGHDVMEALAYRRLMARPRRAGAPPGMEMLRFLIREQVLDRPPCFEPSREEQGSCAAAYREDPLRWWPVVRSSEPDNVLYRQFGSDGQCYHFMARAEDVIDSEREISPGVPELLATRAYARCMRLLDALLEDAVQDPARAVHAVTGAYALMHIVADSFSAAHAARDSRGRVRHLKPWRMRTWGRYLLHPRAWRYHVGSSHHHVYGDPRDHAWLARDDDGEPAGGCDEGVHPYGVAESCLSRRGLRVVGALEQLLVVLYELRLAHASGAPHGTASQSASWVRFRARHFAAAPGREIPPVRDPIERDRIASGGLGVTWEHEHETGAESVIVVERSLPLRPRDLHPSQFFSPLLGLGVRRVAGATQLVAAIDLALWLPISGEIAMSIVPLSLRALAGESAAISFGTIPLRIDLAIASYLWIGVTPVRLEWRPGASGLSHSSGLTLGVTLDSPARTPILRGWDRIADELAALGRGQPGPPGTAGGDGRDEAALARGEWTVPSLPAHFPEPARWVVHSSAGVVRPRGDAGGVTWSAAAALLRVARHWNHGDVQAVGGTVRVDITSGDAGLITVGLAPLLRLYVIPDALGLELAVPLIELGARFSDTTPHFDVAVQTSVLLSAFGVELLVDLPRYSALDTDEQRRIGIGARAGTIW